MPPAVSLPPVDPDRPSTAPPSSEAIRNIQTPAWDYSAGLGLGWQSNVAFRAGDDLGDYAGTLQGNLSRLFRSPRGEFSLSGSASGYKYSTQGSFDRFDAELALDGNWRLSPRTRTALNTGFAYGHTNSSRILGDQGVLLPLSRTYSYSGALSLDHQLGSSTSLIVQARAYRVEFDSDLLATGSSMRGAVGLRQRLGRRDSVSLQYSHEWVRGGSDLATQYGSLYWTHSWRRTALRLEGGASRTDRPAAAGLERAWYAYGGISVNREVGRSSLSAFYRREVIPVFGFEGLRVADRLGLQSRLSVGQRWGITLDGVYVSDPARTEADVRLRSVSAGASLGRGLGRWFGASLNARYRRRLGAVGGIAVDDASIGFFVTAGRARQAQR